MKKTLIALFALSSMALAADYTINPVQDITATKSNSWVAVDKAENAVYGSTDANKWGSSFSASFDLSQYAITLSHPTHTLSLTFEMEGLAHTNTNHSTVVTLVGADRALSVGQSYSKSQEIYIGTTPAVDRTAYEFETDSGHLAAGSYFTVSDNIPGVTTSWDAPYSVTMDIAWVDAANGFVATLTSPDSRSEATINLGSTFDASKMVVSVEGLGMPAVKNISLTVHTPEPATATLSLLALAGLAARRKRH